ncbi:inorganic phosphate transporter [Nonomuraea phyllanthi]|uniref:Inorganic phosphate transporter n=1 Tax=Nonomuraea phyllanthi TaxID=2219224 RepID=A0A5C4VZS0_9ACTN|nr:inorganic phosphate transporter [Nonomuraea phyllanthi]KAB8190830.1 inorganic phosphate transporter [Nonomuraea phyllanthi]QFY11826.1 inorganic phosphate transporter [Nonomuraea phyllanthi]
MGAVVLIVVAGLFAVVSGVNDGGALLATGLKLPTIRPAIGVLVLVVMVALIPLATHQVALTFVTRLASFHQPGGQTAMTIAVIASLAVVAWLSAKGRPTSLTLAIVGGLAGAGLGWGLPVSPGSVLLVLAFAVAAPLVGGLLAWLLIRMLVVTTTARRLRRWHQAGFLVQTVAYAANDGQKMLAVFMVAFGFTDAPLPYTLLVAVLFGLGTVYGLPKAGRTLGRELIASRPPHGVAAELSAGASVIACAAVGMPVSMTQAIAGGLIGAGVAQGSGRVRWYAAGKIIAAWFLTLPASALLGWTLAVLLNEFASMDFS